MASTSTTGHAASDFPNATALVQVFYCIEITFSNSGHIYNHEQTISCLQAAKLQAASIRITAGENITLVSGTYSFTVSEQHVDRQAFLEITYFTINTKPFPHSFARVIRMTALHRYKALELANIHQAWPWLQFKAALFRQGHSRRAVHQVQNGAHVRAAVSCGDMGAHECAA